jgi:hypothetical protein
MAVGIKPHNESIFSSEVYRELERQAVRKGFFNPTPEEQVKLAAQEVHKLELTGDLTLDIPILAESLRARGYSKQANDLEQKFMLFKQAEVHLYHVHDEEGEDLLDFAHKDGDVEVAPAQEERGKVETVQSAAKKILEVVRKQPTGKFASKTGLKKVAQQPALEDPVKAAENHVKGVFDALKKALILKIDLPTLAGRDLGRDQKARQIYAWLSGGKPSQQQILRYYRALQALGATNGNQVNDQFVRTWVYNNRDNPDAIRNLGNLVGAPLYGILPPDQHVSVVQEQIIPAIVNGFRNMYNTVWGQSWAQAPQKIRNIYDKVVTAVNAINKDPGTIVNAAGDIDLKTGMERLKQIADGMNAIKSSNDYKNLRTILAALNPGQLQAFDKFWAGVDPAINAASEGVAKGRNIGGTITGLAGKLGGAYKKWEAYRNSLDPDKDKEEREKAAQIMGLIAKLSNAVKDEQPFVHFMRELPGLADALGDQSIGQIRNLEGLRNYVTNIEAETAAALG